LPLLPRRCRNTGNGCCLLPGSVRPGTATAARLPILDPPPPPALGAVRQASLVQELEGLPDRGSVQPLLPALPDDLVPDLPREAPRWSCREGVEHPALGRGEAQGIRLAVLHRVDRDHHLLVLGVDLHVPSQLPPRRGGPDVAGAVLRDRQAGKAGEVLPEPLDDVEHVTHVHAGQLVLSPDGRPSPGLAVLGHMIEKQHGQALPGQGAGDHAQELGNVGVVSQVQASVRKVYNVLRSILGAAEESGVIGRSPCIGIKLGAPRRVEPRFLSPGEIARLANTIAERHRALVLLAAYGGLRFGELTGLKIDRVDFLRSRLTVQDSIVEVGGHLHRGPTKTGPARMVTLPRFLTEALAAHVAAFPSEDGLMFTGREGGPIRRTAFMARHFRPSVAKAGLAPLRFHDLRHTAAALAIQSGAHPKAIAERLGHASITTTLNQYGHLFPALDEELAARLDNVGRPFAGRDEDGIASRTLQHRASSS